MTMIIMTSLACPTGIEHLSRGRMRGSTVTTKKFHSFQGLIARDKHALNCILAPTTLVLKDSKRVETCAVAWPAGTDLLCYDMPKERRTAAGASRVLAPVAILDEPLRSLVSLERLDEEPSRGGVIHRRGCGWKNQPRRFAIWLIRTVLKPHRAAGFCAKVRAAHTVQRTGLCPFTILIRSPLHHNRNDRPRPT